MLKSISVVDGRSAVSQIDVHPILQVLGESVRLPVNGVGVAERNHHREWFFGADSIGSIQGEAKVNLIVNKILIERVNPPQGRRRRVVAHDPKRMPYHSWFHFWIQRVDRGHEFRGEQTKMFLGKRRFHRQNGRPDPLDLRVSLRSFEENVVSGDFGEIGGANGGVEPRFKHEGGRLLLASTRRGRIRLCRLFE